MGRRFFRCYFCDQAEGGYEFTAEVCVCPRCGSGHPVVLELTPVHFIYPDRQGPMLGHAGRRWRMACEPQRKFLGDGYTAIPATDNPRVVTCPLCRKTKAFEASILEQGVPLTTGGLRIEGDCC